MFDFNVGSIVSAIEQAKNAGEHEDLLIRVASAAVSDYIHASWDLGRDLEKSRWGIIRAIGHSMAHGALSTVAIFLAQPTMKRFYLALPKDILDALPGDLVVVYVSKGKVERESIESGSAAPVAGPKVPVAAIGGVVDDPAAGVEFGG